MKESLTRSQLLDKSISETTKHLEKDLQWQQILMLSKTH